MTLKGWRVVKPQHNQSINQMTVSWTLTRLQKGQICITMHLYGENVEKSIPQNVLKTNGLNLRVIEVVKRISYNQMYKIVLFLNAFSETAREIFTRFHMV